MMFVKGYDCCCGSSWYYDIPLMHQNLYDVKGRYITSLMRIIDKELTSSVLKICFSILVILD